MASVNSYNQIIISGDKSAVFQTGVYCKRFGAHHVLKLNVNIPAHCSILKPIAKKLKKILNNIHIKSPKIPIINNIDVKSENKNKNIKQALIKQIYNTVRWQEIIKLIELKKIFIMLEIGPNKILTNLNKQNKKIISFSTHNLENFLRAFRKINEK